MGSLLEIDSATKTCDEKAILSDIAIHCKTGDIVGIFGRNSCGKSTLLQIIYGTLKADHKFVRLDGHQLESAYKNKNCLSYVSKNDFIPQNISVKKSVQLCMNREKSAEFISDDFFDNLLETKISQLSGGESKYLHAKLVLNDDSPFCLLDEPFTGLSPLMVEKTSELIVSKSGSKGIIIAGHNYENLLRSSIAYLF